jgi:FkbM family methyltransferase
MSLKRLLVRFTNSAAAMVGLQIKALNDKGRVVGVQFLRSRPSSVLRGAISSFVSNGRTMRFFVENDFDLIQKVHLSGAFYEREELDIIARHFTGGVFVDVGANVGNHAIYVLTHLGATRAVVFEPNPDAATILAINVGLNALTDKVTIHQVGLADQAGRVSISVPRYNLGEGTLTRDSDGELEIVVGDEILAGEQEVSFIKIDTEGFEISVLEGLRKTLAKHRPAIFIEVSAANDASFLNFCESAGYEVVENFKRYQVNTNYLIKPR